MRTVEPVIYETLLAVVPGILIAFVSWWLSQDPNSSFLAGLVGTTIGLGIAILARITRTGNRIIESRKTILDLLKIENDFFGDEWLVKTGNDLVRLTRQTEGNTHKHALVMHIVDEALERAERDLHKIRVFVGDRQERERANELGRIIEGSNDYVHAVTYDVRNYEMFWKAIGDYYTRVNIEAAQRGVRIARIFVFPERVLKGRDVGRYADLRNTIAIQQKAGIELYIISKELLKSIDEKLYENTTGFVICDGKIFSASYFQSETDAGVNGYICYENDLENLARHFDDLKKMAKSARSYFEQ